MKATFGAVESHKEKQVTEVKIRHKDAHLLDLNLLVGPTSGLTLVLDKAEAHHLLEELRRFVGNWRPVDGTCINGTTYSKVG